MSDKRELVREMYDKVMGASDLDWSEIADKFESGLHPDHLRKMGAGIKLAADSGMLMLSTEPSSELDDLQQLRDLRNEINETYRAKSRSEALRDSVVRAALQMPPISIPASRELRAFGKRTLV